MGKKKKEYSDCLERGNLDDKKYILQNIYSKRTVIIKAIMLSLVIFSILFFSYKSLPEGIYLSSINPFSKLGTSSFSSKELGQAEKEYTPSTETTCYMEGHKRICTSALYSGIRFVNEDETWKPIEQARSLKGSGIECVINIGKDLGDPKEVTCEDYNLTSIKLTVVKIDSKIDLKDYEVPIKYFLKNGTEVKEKETSITFSDSKETKELTLDYKLGEVIHLGKSSTTITLQTPNTQNLEDTFINSGSPTTNNNENGLEVLEGSSKTKKTLVKFNISSIPSGQKITEANLTLDLVSNNLDAGTEGWNVSVHHIYQTFSWDEGIIVWNTAPTEGTDFNASFSDTIKFFGGAGEPSGLITWNVRDIVSNSYSLGEKNTSFYLKPHDKFGTPSDLDRLYFIDKEDLFGEGAEPKLTITYEEDIVLPIIAFIPPTPINDTTTGNSSFTVNVSIEESSLVNFTYRWNNTNYGIYDSDLILMLNFDDYTRLNDTSKYGNNGSATGAVYTAEGKYNGAWSFDGDGDYVELENEQNFDFGDGPFSISVWLSSNDSGVGQSKVVVKSASSGTSGFDTVINYGADGTVGIGNSGYIKYSANIGINNGLWHHVVYMYSGGSADGYSIYVDGQKVDLPSSGGSYNTHTDNDDKVLIGISRVFAEEYFNGLIDEVRVYNRSLSDSEVYQLYASNFHKFNSTLWYYEAEQSLNATDRPADGSYLYQAYAKNEEGNSNSTEERTINFLTPQIKLNLLLPPNVDSFFNISQNLTSDVTVEVCCANVACGEVNVSLDPIIPGCDIANSDCTSVCEGIFVIDQTWGDWTNSGSDYCYDDMWWIPMTYSDATCDSNSVAGINGDCAVWDDSAFFMGSGDKYWCPSAVRMGRTVTADDCKCDEIFSSCESSYSTYFDFTSEFFLSGEPTKGGLINTTVGGSPFWTSNDNPASITLGEDECYNVTWSVNATGDIGNNYTFFAFANWTNNMVVSNSTGLWNTTIVEGVVPITSTSFTVQIAEGYTEINFTANNKTVSNLGPLGQSSEQPIIEITNTGDVALDVYIKMNETADGFTLFSGLTNDYNSINILDTSLFKIKENLLTSSSQQIWMWLNWTDKTPQTIPRELNLSVQQN